MVPRFVSPMFETVADRNDQQQLDYLHLLFQ